MVHASIDAADGSAGGEQEWYCIECGELQRVPRSAHLSTVVHQFSCQHPVDINPYVLTPANKGYQLLMQGGWDERSGLGPDGAGPKQPVKTILKQDRRGLGAPDSRGRRGGRSSDPQRVGQQGRRYKSYFDLPEREARQLSHAPTRSSASAASAPAPAPSSLGRAARVTHFSARDPRAVASTRHNRSGRRGGGGGVRAKGEAEACRAREFMRMFAD